MKKVLLLLLTILTLGFVAAPLSAQQTVTIGDSASNYYYYPVNMYFNYSLTQQIYTAAEIEAANGGAGTITAISFYYNYTSSFSMEGIKIYMLNVEKEAFTSNTDMVAVSESDKVFEGTFSATGKGWVTITLTTPFEYDGSNLLVCCYDPTNGFPGNSYTFNTATTTNYSGCTYYSDSNTPDLTNITSFSGSTNYTKYHNRIRLTITPNPDACYGVASTKTSGVSTNEATFSWSPREGQTEWEVYCGTGNINLEEVEWIPVSLPDTSYTFSGLNANTPYTAYIRTVCGEQYSSPRSASFRTDCDLLTGLPYEENFEDVPSGSNVMPFCWDRDTLSTTYPNAYNSSSSAHQGNRYLYFYSKANTAFLPETDGTINISETQLTFWAKTGTAETPLQIGVVDEEGHFDLVYSLPLTTTYKSYTIPFHLYEGSGTRVALRSTNTNSIYVDDLVWEEIDECTKPISATCTPAVTSADFSWFSNGSTFTLYYKEATASEWEQVDVTGLEYTLDEQLTPNTQYKWYVETACGMDTEFRTDSMTFTTTMAPVELPYTATFDEEDEWLLHNGTCTNVWVANEIEEGVNGLFITRDTNTLVKRYKISTAGTVTAEKAFIIGDAIEYALDFDFRCGGESTWDYIKVFLAPTSNEYPASNSTSVSTWDANGYSTYAADFTEYLPATYTSTIAPYKLNLTHDSTLHISVIMNNPVENADASTMAKLVFVWRNDGSGSSDSTGAIISNIHLEALSCGRPDSLKVSEVEAHTAQVYFAPALESDNAWEYALLHDTMTIEDADIIPVGESSFELSDLLSGTAYTLYVRTACGGDQSAWTSAVNFTTTVTCSAPRNLTVSQITGNSALVTWENAQIGAYGYSVQYKQATEEEWNGDPYESIESPYMLSGLDPQTPYIVKVNSLCDDGESFATKPFTTPCLSGGEFQIGEGTTASSTLPTSSLWRNGYTQQIFTSSEMHGASNNITSLSLYMSTYSQSRHYDIYLAHTDATDLSSGWATTDGAQLVYTSSEGLQTLHTGWNTFNFITPFAYNGSQNLLVIFVDNNPNYTSGNNWHTTPAPGGSRYVRTDGSTYTVTPPSSSTGTVDNNRNTIRFGGQCDEIIPCLAPNAYLSDITSTTVTVNWVPGYDETAWALEYQADGETEWTPADASNSPSVIDGLEANTLYTFRLKSVCGDEYSNPKTMQARTNCSEDGITDLPFIETFDSIGTGTGVLPFCWHNLGSGVYVNSTHYGEGTGSLYLTVSTANHYNTAITPMFNASIPVNTLQATFRYRGGNATSRIIVGVMVDPDSNNTFVPIDTIAAGEDYTEWTEHIVKFDTYEGEGQYIAFKNKYTTATSTSYIDNLVIDEIPNCDKPIQLVATSSTADSITLSWNGLGATAWDIVYGPMGFDPEQESQYIELIENVTENPYTLHELPGGIAYEFYVRGNCGDDLTSEWNNSPAVALTYANINMGVTGSDTLTGCGFTITDNGGLNGDYSNDCDFTMVIYPSDDSVVTVSGIFAGEGAVDYLSIYSGTTVDEAYLIKKVYSTMNGGVSGQQITFGPYVSETGPLTLHFHSDYSVVKAGFVAATSCAPAPNCPSPVKNSVTISAIDGHNATVHFVDYNENHNSWTVHYRPTNASEEVGWMTVLSDEDTTMAHLTDLYPQTTYQVYVTTNCDVQDDPEDATNIKTFTTTVACPAPTDLTTTNIYGHVATVNWVGTAESYTIRYNASGSTDTTYVDEDIEGNTYTLTNLDPTTTYQVHIKANCSGDDGSSIEAHTSFTTTVACFAPQNINVTNLTTNSATVNWTGAADSYILKYRAAGGEMSSEYPVYDTTYNLEGLEANTAYTVYIVSDCGEDSLSTTASFTFTTLCEDLPLPYYENFNSYPVTVNSSSAPSTYPNDVMPDCWTFLNRSTSSSTNPQVFLSKYSAYAVDTTCLFFKSKANTPLYAVLPHFSEALNTLQITFSYRNEGTSDYNGTLHLGYMTDPTVASTYTEIRAYAQTTTITEVTEMLANIPEDAAHGYLVFQYMGGNGTAAYYLSLDNIKVEPIPSCPRPTSLEITESTTHTVTLSWTAPAGQENWQIAYGAPGFNPNTTANIIPADENPFTVTNLASSSSYQFYVRAICSETDTSEWSLPVAGATECDVVSAFPYTEGFESGLGCWTSNPVTGTSNWTTASYYYSSSTAPVENSHIAYIYANSHGNVVDLTSPIINLTSLSNPYLSFYQIRTKYVNDLDSLKLYYKTSSTAEPVLLASYTNALTTWAFDSIALPNPSAEYQLIFRGYIEFGHGIGIDAITIADANGSAPVVTNPTVVTDPVSNLGETNATLNGTINNPSGVTLTGKGFKWQQDGAATFNDQPVTGNILTHTLTGLTANTTYRYKAYISYADTTVYGNEVTFTTNGGSTPTNPTVATNDVTDRTQTSAILHATITNPSDVEITAKGFEWRATTGGTFAPITGTGTGNEFTATLTGLQANTSYTYKAFITYAGGTTVYGSTVTFTTLPEDVQPCATPQNVTAVSHSKESIDVSWDANADVTAWNIQYRKQNVETWSTANTTENSYTIGGLTPETTYEIQVQAVCSSGSESDWTASVTATTLPDGLQEHLASQIVLYPNPAKEFVTVQCTENGQFEVTGIEVFDVYGKLINTVDVVENPTRINVSSLANGMYFVRVTTDAGAVTKTFVKK